MNAAVVDLLRRLDAFGLLTTDRGLLTTIGETPEGARLRQLVHLQLYSQVSTARDDSSYFRGLRRDRLLLEQLSGWHLNVYEAQIIEQVTKLLDDWQACIEQLYRAGHRLPAICLVTGMPMKTLRGWYPDAAPESSPIEPTAAPPSQARN